MPCSPVLCSVVLCCRVVLRCPFLLLCLFCCVSLFAFSYFENNGMKSSSLDTSTLASRRLADVRFLVRCASLYASASAL